MAASTRNPKAASHTRKTSLPSASHPLLVSAEEHLQRLKSSEGASSSHTFVCQQLKGLKNLYESLDDLLQLPFSQQVLSHERSGKWTEDVLDGSIKILDVCGAIRDCFSQMKEGVKEVESSLRRRRVVESGLEDEVGAYMTSKKKLHKMVCKCFRDMKRAEKNHAMVNKDSDLEPLFNLLKEVQQISFAVLESSLSFISQPKARSRPSGWSLVSQLLQPKKVSCKGEVDHVNEVEKIDSELLSLIHKKSNPAQMQNVQKRLEVLELRIVELEEEFEAIFRLLLKTRVSLLNIVNY